MDGRETDAWGLKKGMRVSATKVVEVPEVHVQRTQYVSGKLPPPPPPVAPPPADAPILIAAAGPAPVLATPAELPKTGSLLPLIGLLGSFSLLSSIGLGLIRKCL